MIKLRFPVFRAFVCKECVHKLAGTNHLVWFRMFTNWIKSFKVSCAERAFRILNRKSVECFKCSQSLNNKLVEFRVKQQISPDLWKGAAFASSGSGPARITAAQSDALAQFPFTTGLLMHKISKHQSLKDLRSFRKRSTLSYRERASCWFYCDVSTYEQLSVFGHQIQLRKVCRIWSLLL